MWPLARVYKTEQLDSARAATLLMEATMSKLNGDRARFLKNRKRRILRRVRLHAALARLQTLAAQKGRTDNGE